MIEPLKPLLSVAWHRLTLQQVGTYPSSEAFCRVLVRVPRGLLYWELYIQCCTTYPFAERRSCLWSVDADHVRGGGISTKEDNEESGTFHFRGRESFWGTQKSQTPQNLLSLISNTQTSKLLFLCRHRRHPRCINR